MLQGRAYIRNLDEKKQIIEKRNTRLFQKLYKRIANDLINLLTKNQNVNFTTIFQNYQPDYIFLFRNIYQDVKEAKIGTEIRQQLNFNKRNFIEVKNLNVPMEEQDSVNDTFDEEYTKLLNNRTEELANADFINSEARYFENLVNNSVNSYNNYTTTLQNDLQETRSSLLELSFILSLTKVQKERQKILAKRQEKLQSELQNLQDNKPKEINKIFKKQVQEKIPTRSKGNAEYGTGQATSEIKELEKTVVTATLASIIEKVWWERTQFLGGTPRENHLALNGTSSNNGLFNLGGYTVERPRSPELPIEETAYCRCEVEYRVV